MAHTIPGRYATDLGTGNWYECQRCHTEVCSPEWDGGDPYCGSCIDAREAER